jgi:hypothetical protein
MHRDCQGVFALMDALRGSGAGMTAGDDSLAPFPQRDLMQQHRSSRIRAHREDRSTAQRRKTRAHRRRHAALKPESKSGTKQRGAFDP